MNMNNANKRCKNYLKAEGYFDPCHNWAHTGILIEKAQLRLTFDINLKQWIAGKLELAEDGETTYVLEELKRQDKNSNIAVVKAFLAYLDSKRENQPSKNFDYDDESFGNH